MSADRKLTTADLTDFDLIVEIARWFSGRIKPDEVERVIAAIRLDPDNVLDALCCGIVTRHVETPYWVGLTKQEYRRRQPGYGLAIAEAA